MDNTGINILCTVIGAVVGIYVFFRLTKKDTEDKATSNTRMADRLDSIKTGVDDIRMDIKAQGMEPMYYLGDMGKGKVIITCLNCGHKWKAGKRK